MPSLGSSIGYYHGKLQEMLPREELMHRAKTLPMNHLTVRSRPSAKRLGLAYVGDTR